MTRALIGHTGFVGGNLDAQGAFDARFNSKNFREMAGRRFDEVWCAGVQAVKWWANKEPEQDMSRIRDLLDVLATVECRRFVLLSTVDVYASPLGPTEATPATEDGLQPYGLHRLRVERFVASRFPGSLAVRLPGLFGPGLKKNAVYDMIHDNGVGALDPGAVFQFYGLGRIHADIDRALAAGLSLVNLAPEPVRLGLVAREVFGIGLDGPATGLAYDMRTRHGAVYGRPGSPYVSDAGTVLADIAAFVAAEREGLAR